MRELLMVEHNRLGEKYATKKTKYLNNVKKIKV